MKIIFVHLVKPVKQVSVTSRNTSKNFTGQTKILCFTITNLTEIIMKKFAVMCYTTLIFSDNLMVFEKNSVRVLDKH